MAPRLRMAPRPLAPAAHPHPHARTAPAPPHPIRQRLLRYFLRAMPGGGGLPGRQEELQRLRRGHAVSRAAAERAEAEARRLRRLLERRMQLVLLCAAAAPPPPPAAAGVSCRLG